MDWKLSNLISGAIPVFASLLAASAVAFAQSTDLQKADTQEANGQTANTRQIAKLVYRTPPKTFAAKLKSGASNVHEVRGKVTFTPTTANNDDTVAGTLVYAIPDEARQKIAQVSGKLLSSIPASMAQKDVVASFRSGASCPVVSIEIGATELDVAGVKLGFNRIVVDVIETSEQIPQHFCAWTRQINAKRPRRGIIASLNRLISVEP